MKVFFTIVQTSFVLDPTDVILLNIFEEFVICERLFEGILIIKTLLNRSSRNFSFFSRNFDWLNLVLILFIFWYKLYKLKARSSALINVMLFSLCFLSTLPDSDELGSALICEFIMLTICSPAILFLLISVSSQSWIFLSLTSSATSKLSSTFSEK